MHDVSPRKEMAPAALGGFFPKEGTGMPKDCVPPRSLHHWPDAVSAPRTTRWGPHRSGPVAQPARRWTAQTPSGVRRQAATATCAGVTFDSDPGTGTAVVPPPARISATPHGGGAIGRIVEGRDDLSQVAQRMLHRQPVGAPSTPPAHPPTWENRHDQSAAPALRSPLDRAAAAGFASVACDRRMWLSIGKARRRGLSRLSASLSREEPDYGFRARLSDDRPGRRGPDA